MFRGLPSSSPLDLDQFRLLVVRRCLDVISQEKQLLMTDDLSFFKRQQSALGIMCRYVNIKVRIEGRGWNVLAAFLIGI